MPKRKGPKVPLDKIMSDLAAALKPAFDAQSDAESDQMGDGFAGVMTCSACPVQIEGTVDGHAFYFRARHDAWSFGVSLDRLLPAQLEVSRIQDEADDHPRSQAVMGPYAFEAWGDSDNSGWMKYSEAWDLVRSSIAQFRAAAVDGSIPARPDAERALADAREDVITAGFGPEMKLGFTDAILKLSEATQLVGKA